jgi:hypothetical protein
MANAKDNDFMAATYPSKAGTKWDADKAGPMPTHKNHMDAAAIAGVRLGSKQALALALTFRACGSTSAQRAWAGDGKPQNNVGGLQDLLRSHAPGNSAKLVAGQVYKLTLSNGAVIDVVSDRAGHVAAKLVTPPTVQSAPKVASKVAAKAAATKADKGKGKSKAKAAKAKAPATDAPDAAPATQPGSDNDAATGQDTATP